MKINKINYEAYAIDYLEGTLSSADRKAFEELMAQYPAIKQELDDYLEAPLLTEDESILFEGKAELVQQGGNSVWLYVGMLVLVTAIGAWLFFGKEEAQSELKQKKEETVKPMEIQPTEKETDKAIQFAETETKTEEKIDKVDDEYVRSSKTISTKKVDQSPMLASVISKRTEGNGETKNEDNFSKSYQSQVKTTTQVMSDKSLEELASTEVVKQEPLKEVLLKISPVKPLNEKNDYLLVDSNVENISDRLKIEEVIVAEASPVKTEKKQAAWLKVLTPQAYKNINLEKTIAATNLKAAVTEIGKAIVPEVLH